MNKRHFPLLIAIAALSLQGCVSFPYGPTKFSVKLVEGDNDPYVGELVRFESGFQGTTFEVVDDGFLPYDDAFLAVEPGETQIIAHYKGESQSFDFTISEVTDPALILELPTGLQVATSDTFRVSGIGDDEEVELRFLGGRNLVSYEGRTIEGLADGLVNAVAVQGEKLSVPTEMEVGPYSVTPESLAISFNGTLLVGESAKLKTEVHPWGEHYDLSYEVLSGSDFVGVEDDGTLVGLAEGKALVRAKVGKLYSNEVTVEVKEGVDPYEGMDAFDFYLNYEPAESYLDSFYRSRHGFMSGDIEPTRSGEHAVNANRPMEGDQYVRNSSAIYEDGGMTYTVLDENGDKAYSVYYGGGYITAEEVAAYIYAFGETPGNYIDNKHPKSQEDEEQWELWDKYLRCNNSYFSCDVEKYPYEPELPDASGAGGSTDYYEIDIGGLSYNAGAGRGINRGTLRIVYSRYRGGRFIEDPSERHVFYTYNHYNDFEEFLNYEGGWGLRFGNITGGGSYDSKTDYNPTPYPETVMRDFAA